MTDLIDVDAQHADDTFEPYVPDFTFDMSDAYQELHDADNEHSILCIACFDMTITEVDCADRWHATGYDHECVLTGVTLDDGHGQKFVNREAVIELMGMDFVWQAEELATTSANDQ